MNHITPRLHSVEASANTLDAPCDVMAAIRDALAILDAISQGGLLSAMPELESDRERQQTGHSMLDLLERRLRQAVGDPAHPISGECRCDGRQHCGPLS